MKRLAVIYCAILMATAAADAALAAPANSVATGPTASEARAYILSSGDKLKITVFNVASLSGEYPIGPGGEIALPLIGDVKAAGNTVDELSNTIRKNLGNGFVNDPKVTVEIVNYSPYYILGEVNKPGQFPYLSNLTVEQAVASAGGYTYRAARRKAYLRHAGGSEQLVKFRTDPVFVQPGDTIRIGERYL